MIDLLLHPVRRLTYKVLLDGEVIAVSPDPEFAACKALAARGYKGAARFWRAGKACHDIEIHDICKAAKLRTVGRYFIPVAMHAPLPPFSRDKELAERGEDRWLPPNHDR